MHLSLAGQKHYRQDAYIIVKWLKALLNVYYYLLSNYNDSFYMSTWLVQEMTWALNFFSGCVFQVFPKEIISIGFGWLSKTNGSLHCGWAPVNLLRAWIKQKGRGKWDLHSEWLLELRHLSPYALSAHGSQAFRLGLGSTPSSFWPSYLWTVPLVLLSLQLADGRSWD